MTNEKGSELISVGVGPKGEALALWSSPAGREVAQSSTVDPGGASFSDAQTAPVDAHITFHGTEPRSPIRFALTVAHPFVQPLPDGQVLVVGARCRWGTQGADANAWVFDADGDVVAAATFGDGVQHVATTPSGRIWTSYFDEGIFGNYGWGSPGPEPIGSAGLIRWTRALKEDWRFPGGAMADCYALNASAEDAWAYYYDSFPIVRTDGRTVEEWQTQVDGATSLVVADGKAALVGGYRPAADRVVAGMLSSTGSFEPTSTGRLTLDDRSPLPPSSISGRGPDLHAFVGTRWYRISIDDLSLPEPPQITLGNVRGLGAGSHPRRSVTRLLRCDSGDYPRSLGGSVSASSGNLRSSQSNGSMKWLSASMIVTESILR